MLEYEKFLNTLKLAVLFSFFLFSLSFVIDIFLLNTLYLFANTFLNSMAGLLEITLKVIFMILRYTSAVFFVGSLIAIFIIFINDWLLEPTRK